MSGETNLEKPGKTEPPDVATEQIENPKAPCTFIFVRHSKNVFRSAEIALKEGDTILVEAMGLSNEERRKIEKRINELSDTPYDADKAHSTTVGLSDLLPLEPDIIKALIRKIGGTGKKFFLIDVSEEEPVTKTFGKRIEQLEERLSTVKEAGQIKKAYRLFKDWIQATVQEVEARETVMVDQIKDRIFSGSEEEQARRRIVVIMGGAHTYPSHLLAREKDVSIRRIFSSERFIFKRVNELIRKLRFPKTKEKVEEEDYLRAFLEFISGDLAIEWSEQRGVKLPVAWSRKIGAEMTPDQIDNFVQNLEKRPGEAKNDYPKRHRQMLLSLIERDLREPESS